MVAMDLLFRCRSVLHIPRDGTTTLGRRKPIKDWDHALISRNHLELHVNQDGTAINLSVTGRNAVVVERQTTDDGPWDVVAVVDPGSCALLPLPPPASSTATRTPDFFSASQLPKSELPPDPPLPDTTTPPQPSAPTGSTSPTITTTTTTTIATTRLYIVGARDETAVELRPTMSTSTTSPPPPGAAAAVAAVSGQTATTTMEATTALYHQQHQHQQHQDEVQQPSSRDGDTDPMGQPPTAKRRRSEAPVAATAAGTTAAIPSPVPGSGGAEGAPVSSGNDTATAMATNTNTNTSTGGGGGGGGGGGVLMGPRVTRRSPGSFRMTSPPPSGGGAGGSGRAAGAAAAAVPPPYDIDSPVHLLAVRGLSARHNAGCLGVRLRSLLSGPLQLVLVSNYMVDMGWLMSCCPDLARAQQFFVVHGESADSEPEMRLEAAAAGAPHMQLHRPPLPIAYGTHHSKAFLATYPMGLRLIIHTANAIYADCNDKSQGLWVQDFPRKNNSDGGGVTGTQLHPPSAFEHDLLSYIRSLGLPPSMAAAVAAAITAHDFSAARGALVTSVPGYHRGTAVQLYGHMRLRRLLELVELPAGFRGGNGGCGSGSGSGGGDEDVASEGLVIQCSSLGSFDQAWLVDELGASLAPHRQMLDGGGGGASGGARPASLSPGPPPRPSGPPGSSPLPLAVVWPTVEEVRNSVEGWAAGRSIPGPAKNVTKPFMRRYYSRWGGEVVGRQRAMPHIKTYTRYRCQQLAWFLVASHNLSKAAWGELQKNGTQVMIRSYELGVLVTPGLEAAYRSSSQYGFCCHPAHHHQRHHQQQAVAAAAAAAAASPSRPAAPPPPAPAPALVVTFWTLAGAASRLMELGDVRLRSGGEVPVGLATEATAAPESQEEVVVVLPVPYSLPPGRYGRQDEPWSVDVPRNGVDALGLSWGVPMTHYGHREPAESDGG